jgi:hypothetical protein
MSVAGKFFNDVTKGNVECLGSNFDAVNPVEHFHLKSDLLFPRHDLDDKRET